jgi:UDP-N-acetylglucosamine acyltransferase
MDETHTVKTLNLVGLRRNGFGAARVRAIKNAFVVLFRGGPNMRANLEKVEAELEITEDVRYLIDFIRNSKRGVCFGKGATNVDFE